MAKSLAPNTEPRAKPTGWQTVSNATVLKVQNGTYRNAVFDGVFLVDEIKTAKYKYSKDAVLLVFASDYYDSDDYIRDYAEFLKAVAS